VGWPGDCRKKEFCWRATVIDYVGDHYCLLASRVAYQFEHA
jgi:hypothetical protein